MTNTTLYTIRDSNGEVLDQGCTAREAAQVVLAHDGCDYEIRADEDCGFSLWTRQQVAGRKWARNGFMYSFADTLEQAENEIFARVILECGSWRPSFWICTDEAYAAELAEAQ